jgi:diaminopimelate decarboxylase
MHPFTYRNGALHAEDVPLAALAEAVGTPFYCYSSAAIAGSFKAFRDAFAGQNIAISYAMKANSNQAVLTTLARIGAGMDVVSEGELPACPESASSFRGWVKRRPR